MSIKPDFDQLSWAFVSHCSRYRYWLHRQWLTGEGCLVWIMLNPSTADALRDDATIRRCINFAKAMGYRGIIVVNLCAYRATVPIALLGKKDPEGPHNRQWIMRALECAEGGRIVAGWGGHAIAIGPVTLEVREWLRDLVPAIYCLGTTQDGHPRHPLYVPNGTELARYNWRI